MIRHCLRLLPALALTAVLPAQAPKIEFPVASPRSIVKQRIELTEIEINYSRPSLKGRVMVGQINPYGEVWRTGANEATRLTFSTPVKVQGHVLPADTYELFTIPGKDQWTVIFQKAGKQWGAYTYKPENDVLRVTAKPQAVAPPVESFTIDINDLHGESATLNLIWADWRVSVPLEVDTASVLVPQLEKLMASDAPKKPYDRAALFYRDHNLDLKQAAAWMDAAVAEHPDAYYLLYHQATIRAKLGDKAGAIAAAKRSTELAIKAKEDGYVRLNKDLMSSLR